MFILKQGNCLDVLKTLKNESIDSVVTDPPYELGFMGKKWDSSGIAYSVDMWREVFRVLKPGGHLLSFGGTRTYHRMTCAIEDSGFDIRDSLDWIYGSGFPKSLNVSKAIDDAAGAVRLPNGTVTTRHGGGAHSDKIGQLNPDAKETPNTIPATAEAIRFDGWGTALKPAHEPIVLARKPLEGTVAANVLTHGTGGINVEACRVGTEGGTSRGDTSKNRLSVQGAFTTGHDIVRIDAGRWPPNLLLTHSPNCVEGKCVEGCPGAETDRQSGYTVSRASGYNWGESNNANPTHITKNIKSGVHFSDRGGASRFFPCFEWNEFDFFYVAKVAKKERDAGCETLQLKASGEVVNREEGSAGINNPRAGAGRTSGARNYHPTVKPIKLMEWLVKLVTPEGGIVLDPFVGSGSTGAAACRLGFNFIGIDLDEGYLEIAKHRIEHWSTQPQIMKF